MSVQRISTGPLIAAGVLVLVLMIAGITFLASTIINQTILEQFETSELQLVTSLSQQTQASLTNLNAEVANLSVQEEVRATSATRLGDALALLAESAEDYPEGTIVSITRFDFRGNPRYAWPPRLNEAIETLESPEDYRYQIPSRYLELTERGERVTADIDIELNYLTNWEDGGVTTVLIAPVDSVSLNTEYLAIEVNLSALFTDLFDFLQLGETGQLWVIDGRSNVQYQARETPSVDVIFEQYTFPELRAVVEPRIDTYPLDDQTFQASIASTQALSNTFIVFLTRNQNEAQEDVNANLIAIFTFAVAAMLGVVGLGSIFARQIARATAAQRAESQRRQTARILLEVSRALNSSLDLEVVLQTIMQQLERIVPHDSAAVFLLEDDELRVAANRGLNFRTEEAGERFKLSEARAAKQVVDTSKPLVINDTSADDRWTDVKDNLIGAWMGLPLVMRDSLVGVLNINNREKDTFREEDIDLAEAFADQASVAIQNARLHEIEVQQYEQELVIARGIQTSLLPSQPPQLSQIEVATSSLPASQVSGDYFQYLPLPDGKMGIAIGDVQGKGIPAALMMAVITTAMRDEFVRNQDPAALLQSLNLRLLDRMRQNHMNSALIMALFDPKTREIEIANGGMVQPYVRYADTDNFDFVPVGGYPLGVSDSMRYTAKSLKFDVGSVMVMFSDGVLEAQNPAGEFFGFERIEALLDSMPKDASAEHVLEAISAAVRDHLGGQPPQDDTTIMVLRALEFTETPDPVDEPSAESDTDTVVAHTEEIAVDEMSVPALITTFNGEHQRKNIELYLPSQLGFEKVARGTAEALAREVGFPLEKIEDIKTAISEACMNAIEHGNLQDPTKHVSVMLSASLKRLEIRVTDSSEKRLPKELPEGGLGDMRGWGLFFMSNLMDEFDIQHLPGRGNQVVLVAYRPDPEKDVLASSSQMGNNTNGSSATDGEDSKKD